MNLNAKQNAELPAGINIRRMTAEISAAPDLESACAIFDNHLKLAVFTLLSAKYCDIADVKPAFRPFGIYPCEISSLAARLTADSGCPITREALDQLAPFDAMEIEPDRYPDFLSRRFLDELVKVGHKHIAVIPIKFGRGLALYTIGTNILPFVGETRDHLINLAANATAAILGRFSNVATLFEPKYLSLIEAEMALMLANGNTVREIAGNLGYSEFTVEMILVNASKKLNAKSRAHLVAKAMAFGEFANLHR